MKLKNISISLLLTASMISVSGCDTKEEVTERPPIPDSLIKEPVKYPDTDPPLYLYPWEGEHVVLLSDSPSLSESVMTQWAELLDKIYEYYYKCNGRKPDAGRSVHFNGLLPLAQKANIGAAALGGVGWCGIEFETGMFNSCYEDLKNRGVFWCLNIYEMGRNFWFYTDKIGDEPQCTGYSVFMQNAMPEILGIKVDPSGTRAAYEKYMADNCTYDDTIGYEDMESGDYGGRGPDGYSGPDIFAAFCLKLYDTFGSGFVEKLWKAVGSMPNSQTGGLGYYEVEQREVDNFIESCCIAANKDLTRLFDFWRWPISDSARNRINDYNYDVFDPADLK